MSLTHRRTTAAILEGARAEHAAVLEQLSPGLRASLPVDAAGITQAIDHLAEAVGVSAQLRADQARGHHANPAVLHGRVFGRAPLPRATVLAAFVEGARVRERALERLARAAGGAALEAAVRDVLARHPPATELADAPEATLRAAYAAQEEAAIRIAAHLDGADG